MDRSVSPPTAIGTQNGDGAPGADQSDFAPPPNARGRMMLYGVLIVVILAVNAIVFVVGISAGWWADRAVSLQVIAAIAQANLLIAILHRQQWLVSLIRADLGLLRRIRPHARRPDVGFTDYIDLAAIALCGPPSRTESDTPQVGGHPVRG